VVELDGNALDGVRTTSVGSDLAAGQRLQHVVPPGTWFGAAPADGTEWALVGCTVAPGGVHCALLCARACQCSGCLPWLPACVGMHICRLSGLPFLLESAQCRYFSANPCPC
jgi:hypothetical protein